MNNRYIFLLTFLFLVYSNSSMAQCNYFTKIATSTTSDSRHTLGIKDDGTLWAWGTNVYGQLGDGTTTQRNVPTQIGTRTDWINIAVGLNHSVGITANGKIWIWGRNINNSMGDPAIAATQITTPTLLTYFNDNTFNWVDISAATNYTLAIRDNGELWGWGSNIFGQLGVGIIFPVIPIRIGTASNWVSVKVAGLSSFAINSDGNLWAWGDNSFGFLGTGNVTASNLPIQVASISNCASISVGLMHCSAITTDGKLWTWGWNSAGQLGNGTTTDILVPTQVGTATNWATVSTGRYYSSAISNDGKFWAWGYDGNCQMANPNYHYVLYPTEIVGGNNWEYVTTGQNLFYNTKSDGSNVAWGNDYWGQLGYGTPTGENFCSPIATGTTPVFTGLAVSGSSATMFQNNYNMYNSSCALIASVSQRVASLYPIKGNTTAKVWVETTQPPLYVKRHYEIMPATNANAAAGKVTLYFTQAEFNNFNAVNTPYLPTNGTDNTGKSNLRIKKLSGVSNNGTGLPETYTGTQEIINPDDAYIIWNAAASRWEVSFITTGFGGFFITTANVTLPVKLLSFSGKAIGDNNELNWKTASENDFSHFEIERSANAHQFEKIAEVNGNNIGNYTWVDNVQGLRTYTPQYYYRLKMIDLNGSFSYSKVISIKNSTGNSVGNFYLSSGKMSIDIIAAEKGNWNIVVYDITGKNIFTEVKFMQKGVNRICIEKLNKGVNLVKFENGNVVEVRKVIRY